MIQLKEVLLIHELLINRFGGAKGILDEAALDSAIKRPYQTFDGNELYPTALEKAAAIFESIIANHPFMDGNKKRTAYVLMRMLLLNEKQDIDASENDKYEFVMKAASGEIPFEQIKKWLSDHRVQAS